MKLSPAEIRDLEMEAAALPPNAPVTITADFAKRAAADLAEAKAASEALDALKQRAGMYAVREPEGGHDVEGRWV